MFLSGGEGFSFLPVVLWTVLAVHNGTAFCLLHLGMVRVSRILCYRMLHPYTVYLPMGKPGDYFTQ